jgi:hypothetical protein
MTWSFFSGKQPSKRNKKRSRRPAAGRRRPHFENLEQREMLAVITVTNLSDDTLPLLVGGGVSLREAIEAANTNASVDGSTAGSGADIIQFEPGLTGTIDLAAAAGAFTITESLTILGPGLANVTIDATGDTSRIFQINAGDVTIKGLTLTGGAPAAGNGGAINSTTLGMLSIADARIFDNASAGLGGGIFSTGELSLTNVVVGSTVAGEENTAVNAGGGVAAFGGVSLKNSAVLGNQATALTAAGGGVYTTSIVSMQFSTVAGNTSGNRAGGIDAVLVMAQNSTISGNTATLGTGGGIDAGTVVLLNSTVFDNDALAGNGGGIRSNNVTLRNSTVAKNTITAVGSGGGIYADDVLRIDNSIVAGNTAPTNPDLRLGGTTTVIRGSLIQDNTDTTLVATGSAAKDANGNYIGDTAALAIPLTAASPTKSVFGSGAGAGDLAENAFAGGPTPATQTVALTADSLAIDNGNNALAVSPSQGDQRGVPYPRISPFGGTVDMGAFEAQTATALNTTPTKVSDIPTPQNATAGSAFNLSVAGNFTDADGDDLDFAAVRLVDGVPAGSLPAWLTFNEETGQFSGVPTDTDVGDIQIRVTATDNKSVPPPALPTSTFTLTIAATPVVPPVPPPIAVLPYNENFETAVPPALPPSIKVKIPAFTTTNTGPLNDTVSLEATRPSPGSRPVATVDLDPALITATNSFNVTVNVNVSPGNNSTVWSNAVVIFDYQDTNNYKFAGLFQGRNELIIGKVSNGVILYSRAKRFVTQANTTYPISVSIDRVTSTVSVTSPGGPTVTHTYPKGISTGAIGVGTLNANAKFDNLSIV